MINNNIYINNKFTFFQRSRRSFLLFSLYVLIFSYFYNVGVVEFNFIGENPLRVYDFIGLVLVYYFIKDIKFNLFFINSIPFFKWFWYFIIYSFFTLVFFTVPFNLLELDFLEIIQSFIYFYHLFLFFLGGVFILITSVSLTHFKTFIYLIFTFTLIESVIVILQNLGLVDYFWSENVVQVYQGFYSGTLGPNKIVLGITMLFSFSIAFAFYFTKLFRYSLILNIFVIVLSLYNLLLSGSRTSYLGLLVFLTVFFIQKPSKSFFFVIVVVMSFFIISNYNIDMVEMVDKTFENRVENKMSLDEDENVVVGLYDDLGSGRMQLAMRFFENYKENYYFIPLGTGFNNRMLFSTSPHNMYLTLIRDVGIIGLFFYLMWLLSLLFIKKNTNFNILRVAIISIVFSMIVTLFFGEHLYIFRPLFGLLGYFFLITSLLIAPILYNYENK